MTVQVCLDLFSGLGGFSQAFADSPDWEVVTVDVDPEFQPDLTADILNLRPADLLDAIGHDRGEIDVLVVLASPPCTVMSVAAPPHHFDGEQPATAKARSHVSLVFHALGLIRALAPDYWLLENPTGRMRWFLDDPTGTVTYCQYGEEYQKPTDLWGTHPPGLTYRSCSRGSRCHAQNSHGGCSTAETSPYPRSPAERAKVPSALSAAIRDAVAAAVENPPPEQVPLPGTSGGGGRDVE